MNKSIIHQAAQLYSEKSFIQPINSFGEPLSIPPGQTVPMGYRKHCKIAEKHFKAGVAWHMEMTAIKHDEHQQEPKVKRRDKLFNFLHNLFIFNDLNKR